MTRPPGAPQLVERLNRAFGAIAGGCFDFRWWVLAGSIGLSVVCLHFASGIQGDASLQGYFFEGDTSYEAYEAFREDFGSDEVAYIGFEVPGVEYGPWNVEAMGALVRLTEALEDEVPFVYEVTTLANAELTIGDEEGIEISKIRDEWPLTQAELLERREAYLRKPMLVGGIIDEKASFGAIIIEMDRSSNDPPEDIVAPPEQRPFPDEPEHIENVYPQVSDSKVLEILARPEYAAFEFFASGDVHINAYMNRILFAEPVSLLFVSVIVVSIILLLTFRSLVSVLAPILVLLATILATVAFMVVLGFKVGMGFGSTPTLLLAIGVAHSVHILSEFRARRGLPGGRRAALVETMSLVGVPCLLTSVTTAIGFASMSFVPIKALAQSGAVRGFGVLLAFFFSMTLLMSLLSFDWTWPLHGLARLFGRFSDSQVGERAVETGVLANEKGGAWLRAGLDWAARFNIRHQNALLLGFFAFIAVFAIGASRVHVDTNYMNDFWESSKILIDTKRVDSEMGGTTNLVYLFDTGEAERIKEPVVLREIDRLQQLANEEDWLVTKTYSIVDIVKDLNQAFHGDDPAYHVIPESREEIAQYLLLYESSGGEEAEEYVTADYRRANLELRIKMDRTLRMKQLIDGLERDLEADPIEESTVTLTGIGALWLILMDYIMSSQIQAFTLAFLAVTFVMIAIFRSFKIGLISMVPNLAPVFLALGAMGYLDISLDYNKVTIAAIALGISVDDTIHLMMRFHHEFQIHGRYDKALREALRDVGRALVITSVALVFGFLVLTVSELRSQAYYGLLLASALVTALIADFFFMPALVLNFKPFGPEGQGEGTATSSGETELAHAA